MQEECIVLIRTNDSLSVTVARLEKLHFCRLHPLTARLRLGHLVLPTHGWGGWLAYILPYGLDLSGVYYIERKEVGYWYLL